VIHRVDQAAGIRKLLKEVEKDIDNRRVRGSGNRGIEVLSVQRGTIGQGIGAR